jgi:Holliday junction resolvase RusA-like endonuclease
MKILDIDNIQLPRVNNRYNRNFSLTKEYREGKETLVEYISWAIRNKPKLDPPYYVIVDLGTHLDADSCIKPLFDAMQEAGVIDNDKNIHQIAINKQPVKRNEPNWIKVELYHVGESV